MRQEELRFRTWGGRRPGAGRPRTVSSRVPHRTRPVHRAAHPVHVTLRARAGLPPFRERALFFELRSAIASANERGALRVVEFSVQRDHLHLLVEARDKDRLARGVQGLTVRLARAVNRVLRARGKVFRDRYHARELRTPREVRNALVYVLLNARKHGARIPSGVDAFSSAPHFSGFAFAVAAPRVAPPTVAPTTWLARTGWRRRGLIRATEQPRAPA